MFESSLEKILAKMFIPRVILLRVVSFEYTFVFPRFLIWNVLLNLPIIV